MKNYEEEVIPATHVQKHVSTTCDLCGDITDNDWSPGYEQNEAKVAIQEMKAYPEGGWGAEYEYDICPTCFKEKIMPWLKKQGAEPRKRDIDY